MNLTAKHLSVLQLGALQGYLVNAHGLHKHQLVRKGTVYDELRGRELPTGDYRMTTWGRVVASKYALSTERLPVGALMNHRIHAYEHGTVVLADDSDNLCTVDANKPLQVCPDGRDGSWSLPLKGGGWTPGSAREAWYLRNLLGMAIELDLQSGSTADDFLRS